MEALESVSGLLDGYYYAADSTTSSEEPIERPTVVLYGGQFDGWVFNQPVVIYLERDADSFIFSDDLFGIYGHGLTINEALEDYGVALQEYYALLKKHKGDDVQSREAFEQLARFFSPTHEA